MGWNALQALEQHGGPKAIMVVLIGAGHVAFGLGAERQIQPYYKGRISSLIPVPVVDSEGHLVERVRASYATFVWGLPQEVEPLYPTLGVSLMGSLGKEPGQIIRVSNRSVAQRAGIRVGDVLVALDGSPIQSEATLQRLMATYRWADQVRVRIRRDGKAMDLDVPLRRRLAADSH
jgi:S1-C subfamily serine protease